MITRGQSTTIFLCIGPFSAWWQPNEQKNKRVILVQACSWPVRRQFFVLFLAAALVGFNLIIQRSYLRTWLNDKSVGCRKHQCVWFSLCVCLYLSVCVLRKWYKRRQWGGGYVRENSLETSFRNNSYILSPPIFLATIILHFLIFRLWLFITTKFHEKLTLKNSLSWSRLDSVEGLLIICFRNSNK